MNTRAWQVMAVVVGLILGGSAAPAAETIIDDFTSASAQTEYVANTNVLVNAVGTVTRVDPMLTDVLGGVRQMDLTATFLDIPPLDFIVAGVVLPPVPFFEYNSTADADGYVLLTYNRGGAGLFSYLAFAEGIRVTILEADAAAVAMPGLDITITLTDTDMSSAQLTRTVTIPVSPMAPLTLDYPFTDFPGVNVGSLFQITALVFPQIAGDLRLDLVETYGTPLLETICDDDIDNNNNGYTDCSDQDCLTAPNCQKQVPALSPSGMGGAALFVALIGLLAIRRLRLS